MDLKSRIYKFCDYQERSQKEVRNKLYELGAHTTEVNKLLAELIVDGRVNEERFAMAFVRGKFSIKHWGRAKIKYHLKLHSISEYLQKKALLQLNPNEYFGTANRLAERKWQSLITEKNHHLKSNKVFRYLQQKGYENSIIQEIIQDLKNT